LWRVKLLCRYRSGIVRSIIGARFVRESRRQRNAI